MTKTNSSWWVPNGMTLQQGWQKFPSMLMGMSDQDSQRTVIGARTPIKISINIFVDDLLGQNWLGRQNNKGTSCKNDS
jgi:hypothetical protein